jgi:phage antirepressor YoqD-like protein
MNKLIPIEHKNQRVLTTHQLAEAYGTEAENINKNFSRNKERFIEGRDYYFLQGEELQVFKRLWTNSPEPLKYTSQLYLWTERGANRHSKILDTDRAWQQFDILEETYFRVKTQQYQIPKSFAEALRLAADLEEHNQKLLAENAAMKPKAEFFDAVAGSKDAISMGEAAKVLNFGKGRTTLFKILREEKILDKGNIPYQEYIDRGYFRTVEQKYSKPDGSTHINIKTLVYQKGLDYIRKILKEKIG